MEVPSGGNRYWSYEKLPVMTEAKGEAERRKIELIIVPTAERG